MARKYEARICVNDMNTDGEWTKVKLKEYYYLGAEIMVNISGTDLETSDNDLPLDLCEEADRHRFFGKDI